MSKTQLHEDIARARISLAQVVRDFETRRRELLRMNTSLQKALYDLAPHELVGYLSHLEAFQQLMDRGVLIVEDFVIPGVQNDDQNLLDIIQTLKAAWKGIVHVKFVLNKGTRRPRTLTLTLLPVQDVTLASV